MSVFCICSVPLRTIPLSLALTFFIWNSVLNSSIILSLIGIALSKSFSPVVLLKSYPNSFLRDKGTASFTHQVLFLLKRYFLSDIFNVPYFHLKAIYTREYSIFN